MKLDIGCGINKKEGFTGVDVLNLPGVDIVADLKARWPFEDASVDEINCSHFLEHFTAPERCHMVNEMYRVLKPGAKVTAVTPHWASMRAYGDPTHQWPPISEFWFYYLSKEWRATQAPHTDAVHWEHGYNCDFECVWSWSLHPALIARNAEYQGFAVSNYKEAAQDIIATLTRR